MPAFSSEPAATSDMDLRSALEDANIPALLLVLVHLTGDERWLEPPFRPHRAPPLDDNDTGGLPSAVQAEVRDAAFEAIEAWRRGEIEPTCLSPQQVARMLTVTLGEEVPEPYGELLREELGIASRDVVVPSPIGRDFSVLVIGAGFSGLCAAIKLKGAGIPFCVLEKNASVGGTWLENTYPGCGVDTPSHLYSFSFAMNTAWSKYFAKRGEVYDYLERVADRFGVRDDIRFETEVVGAEYDAGAARWSVTARHRDGSEHRFTANALIIAVGMVNRPSVPDLPGLDGFRGPVMHTAQWRDEVELGGKRVAVLGTGASAMQLVPAIADVAEQVIVFQRSKQWALPHPKYHAEVPRGVRDLMAAVPLYAHWYRLRAFWNFGDRLHPQLQVDPTWPHQDRSINAQNERHRAYLTEYVTKELGDRVDLLDACIPEYPPYGKRPLIDNGWYRTVRRDDVDLVTEAVAAVTPTGVATASGAHYEADVIVLATGFKTLQMLWPMEVRGRSGRTLAESWGKDDARAFVGITVADFPNLFILNGPNTNAGHGGSAVLSTELEMRYIMEALRHLITEGHDAVEVRRPVFEQYNQELDDALSGTIWVHPGMTTYYRNDAGRVVLACPWTYLDFSRRLRFQPEDYEFHRLRQRPGRGDELEAVAATPELGVPARTGDG